MAGSIPAASGRIFMSYRLEETSYPAGWLHDRLPDRYGDGQIFKDVDSIQSEAVNLYEAPASGNYWAASSVSGLLIHAVVGRLGGSGSLRTNRSGWAA
jgi:hypothetical protein